jgi:hypothetical protein
MALEAGGVERRRVDPKFFESVQCINKFDEIVLVSCREWELRQQREMSYRGNDMVERGCIST